MIKSSLVILLSILSFASWASEHKSLSCSKNKTLIFFINGMNYSPFQYNRALNILREISASNKLKFDQKDIIVDGQYNTSESFITDFYQLVMQRVAENKQIKSDGAFKFAMAYFFKKQDLAVDAIKAELLKQLMGEELLWKERSTYHEYNDLTLMMGKIRAAINNNIKVIVVSHSQGNMFANKLHEMLLSSGVPKEKIDKYIGNLQVASTAGSVKYKNNRVFSLQEDIALNAFRVSTRRSLVPQQYRVGNIFFCAWTNPIKPPDLCHDFANTYLSSSLGATGPKQGSKFISNRSNRDIFIDNLEEVAWMLANNDEDCCEGRDGRFYRKDYDSEPEKGFLEKTVEYDDELKLEIDKDSQVCGNATLKFSLPGHKIKLVKTSVMGIGSVELKGNIFLKDSSILPNNENNVLRIEGTTDLPLYFEDTDITGGMKISGALIFHNSELSNTGSIEGELFYRFLPYEGAWYSPTIINTKISGKANMQGYYNINRDLEDTTIIGKGMNGPEGQMLHTEILYHPIQINKGILSGFMRLAGEVGSNVTLEGPEVVNHGYIDYLRIYLSATSQIGANSNLKGASYIYNSTFSGTLNGVVYPHGGAITAFVDSQVNDVMVSGAPDVYDSTVNGGSISEKPYILGSNLINPNATCNAKIVGETASNKFFGCHYTSYILGKKIEDRAISIDDYSQSTNELESWIQNKLTEIRHYF